MSTKLTVPQILALPDIQETSDHLSDIGSDLSSLQALIGENNLPVDLSLVKDGWHLKTRESRYNPHSDAISARAVDARLTLRRIIRDLVENGDDDVQVAVITHGGFLHFFMEDWEDAWTYPSTSWRNCETRSYVFEDGIMGDGGEARLVETGESRAKRGKDYPMFGRERQLELFPVAMQEWEKQGLQRPDKWEHQLGMK
ncbi:hypothetical protein DL98DRAFT_416317 [Cadophora sp. DSE1049]|nr:hypothetical protein DL98DRAFT_416317 [Cadophora sp. DSE1049]